MLAPAVLCIAKSMNHQHITLLIIHIDLYLMTQVHPVHVCNHAWPKHMLVADEEIHSAEFSGLWNMLLKWRSCLSLSSDRTVIFNLLDFNWQKGISNTLLLINRHLDVFTFVQVQANCRTRNSQDKESPRSLTWTWTMC